MASPHGPRLAEFTAYLGKEKRTGRKERKERKERDMVRSMHSSTTACLRSYMYTHTIIMVTTILPGPVLVLY